MATETWLVLGAGALSVLSIVAQAVGLIKGPGMHPWTAVTTVARVGAVLLLLGSLLSYGITTAEWLPIDGARVALSLALIMLATNLLLVARLGVDGGGPVLDLIAIALILLGAFTAHCTGALLTCTQQALPFRLEWLLLLLGAGATLVAGSGGLMLALYAMIARFGWGTRAPHQEKAHGFLKQATLLSLAFLGAGLTVGIWWAWRTGASLIGDDPRLGWLAVAWLVVATSLLAWQLGQRTGRWAAALAVLAGAIALFGMLVTPVLAHVMWA